MRARCGRGRRLIQILPLPVEGEIEPGADLAGLLLAVAPPLQDRDVVVVSHKAVSKSEGRVVQLAEVVPSEHARSLAADGGDPRQVELVLRESRRIVRRRGSLLIAETHHGFICAAAGIDRSNTPGDDTVVLLPVAPDASARRIRQALESGSGRRLAVVIADTMGRPLRNGIVGTAIGVSGLAPLRGYRDQVDPSGYRLRTTSVAVADELAAAADLVLGKLERVPAALVRGHRAEGDGSAQELIRDADRDLFL
jgi:coenzyme F420-0:L-glutamate ligase/coenzyme F420-1:gamma-L-glutamate ligase